MFLKRKRTRNTGFSLLELLIVVGMMGILLTLVFAKLSSARNHAYGKRAHLEFRAFETAMYRYLLDNNDVYPPDVSRNIPAGLEGYLSGGSWPDGPWPISVYDWDNIGGANPYIQISLRFCNLSGSECNFPDEDWATGFDSKSAMYYCFQGTCKSHPGRPVDHPGYCINC